jgi:TonB family protein
VKTRSFNSWSRILVTLALAVGMLFSLRANADEGRKIRSKVDPYYPELARRINASGTVRLEIQIAPTGEVKSVKALGGHPLLIPAAEDAIRKWRYEPASETTTTIVEFRFSPST